MRSSTKQAVCPGYPRVVCLSESILTFTGTGETLGRMGNRSRHAAPHAAFRCAAKGDDDDRWLVIAVHSDDEWQRLRKAMDDPAWAAAARYATVEGRLSDVDELEARIGDWTRPRQAEEIVRLLHDAGVEAAVVENFEDLLNDPQLAHRRHFHEVDHPVIGKHLCETNGMRFSRTPESVRLPAPCLGQHTEYICRELIGMAPEEFDALRAEDVFV
jgi:benzylsuccinate CoA-transferase BbsF subunit